MFSEEVLEKIIKLSLGTLLQASCILSKSRKTVINIFCYFNLKIEAFYKCLFKMAQFVILCFYYLIIK